MWLNNLSSCAPATALVVVLFFVSAAAASPRRLQNEAYDRVQRRHKDVCGVPPIKPDIGDFTENIVGGKEAIPHSWPWQIELQLYDYFNCGGSVLEKRWIVTAAHCLVDGDGRPWRPDAIQVVVGQHDRTKPEPMKITTKSKSLHVHEKYNATTAANDIGLIELDTEIPFNEYIQPVCLPTTDFKEGTMCATTGWGEQVPNISKRRQGPGSFRENENADKLMEVAVPIFSNSKCVENYRKHKGWVVDDGMICAGYPEGGKDSCFGDSGGPLVCHGADGVWQLVGITSWGNDCAQPEFPGVYTRVQKFTEWIKNIIH